MVGIFLAFLAIVGFIEFGVYTAIAYNAMYKSAVEGEIIEFSKVFTSWFRNVIIHLVIDAIASAFITAIIGIFLGRG